MTGDNYNLLIAYHHRLQWLASGTDDDDDDDDDDDEDEGKGRHQGHRRKTFINLSGC